MGDKIRPGRITDEQVEAYERAADAAVARAAVMNCGEHDMGDCPYHLAPGAAVRAGLAAAYVRRELEDRTRPTLDPVNLDPYPATVSEVADEIARFVMELDMSGAARGLASEVRGRLDARTVTRIGNPYLIDCTHGADCTVHPDENRVHNLDAVPVLDTDVLGRISPGSVGAGKSRPRPVTLYDADPRDCGHRMGPVAGCTGRRCL